MNNPFKVVIPARYGSTRLPGKPLRLIAGKPMLQHVYLQAVASNAEQVVIATDDQRIVEAATLFGADVCLTNENHLSGTDRIAEVVEHYAWPDDQIIVNVQGDEPLIPPPLIQQVANNLQLSPAAGMATVCTHIENDAELFDPNVVKVVSDHQGFALYFSRAPIPWHREQFAKQQTLPQQSGYFRHIGLYAYRVGFLRRYVTWSATELEQIESLEQLRALWYGEKIHVANACIKPAHGVDTEADLIQVEELLTARK